MADVADRTHRVEERRALRDLPLVVWQVQRTAVAMFGQSEDDLRQDEGERDAQGCCGKARLRLPCQHQRGDRPHRKELELCACDAEEGARPEPAEPSRTPDEERQRERHECVGEEIDPMARVESIEDERIRLVDQRA